MVENLAVARGLTRARKSPRKNSSDFYPFGGGLNLIDSPLVAEPGQCQNALNYEIGFDGGYRRVGGYEKMTGQPRASNPQYYKMPFSGLHRPGARAEVGIANDAYGMERIVSDSGGDAAIIGLQDQGGYGINQITQNGWLSNELYWKRYGTDLWNNWVVDNDWEWENGEIPYLARLRCGNNTSASPHIETVTDPIAVAVGDILYLSVYALWRFGNPSQIQKESWHNALDGLRLQLINVTAGTWNASGDIYVDFSAKGGGVVGKSNHIQSAGVEQVGGNVVRMWAVTHAAQAADSAFGLRIAAVVDDGGSWSNVFNDRIGAMIHFGCPMAVTWPNARSEHHCVEPRDLDNTSLWSVGGGTMVDADLVWSGTAPYADFSKWTDPASGVSTNFMLALVVDSVEGNSPIYAVRGQKVMFRCYVKFTTSQVTAIGVYIGGASSFPDFPFVAYDIYDIENGTNGGRTWPDPQTNVTKSRITEVETDIYLLELETDPCITSGPLTINIETYEEIGGSPGEYTSTYTKSSKYTHITGIRVWSGFDDGLDEEVSMAPVITSDTAKKCPTGHIIMSGSFIGNFEEGSTLDSLIFDRISFDEELRHTWVRYSEQAYLSSPGEFIGECTGKPVLFGENDRVLDADYRARAAILADEWTRPDDFDVELEIDHHPRGVGPIRGVWIHNGSLYCFRDGYNGQEGMMWKATGFGWQQVANLYVVNFDTGTGTEPSIGDVIDDDQTEGYLRYIETTSGTWGVDAAGYMLISRDLKDRSIPNTDEPAVYEDGRNLKVNTVTFAVTDGDSTKQTFGAGGKYEFRSSNLYGNEERERMYFVNGVNKCHEYNSDNDIVKEISTGMTVDTPTHVCVHNHHLFLSFPGGSIQLSGDGDPFSWTPILGATEIAIGQECTGFIEEISNSLLIMARDRTWVLNGNTRANFDLDDFNVNAGAHEWSLQRIGLATYFDDRGFTSLRQTSRGDSVDYQENAQSELIQPLIEELVKNQEVLTSHLIRNRNIYRCYFDDGRCVSIGFDKHNVAGHMLVEYPFVPNVSCSEEDYTGAERIIVGTQDGEVYELESGATFDGAQINAFIRTVLYPSGSPGQMKKYNRARLDGTFQGSLTLAGRVEFDYDDPEWNLGEELDFSADAAGGYWDNFVWDQFIWDKTKSGQTQVKLDGEGTNVSIYLAHNSSIDLPHTLRGMTFQWMQRRDDRRT